MPTSRRPPAFVSDKALAVGSFALTPAASALPLTPAPARELDESDGTVSGKALAAGNSPCVTNRIVKTIVSGRALAAGEPQNDVAPPRPVADAIPLAMIGELSQ